MTPSETSEKSEHPEHPEQQPPVPVPEPGTDESAPPRTQEFGHDGAEHYPTEADPA